MVKYAMAALVLVATLATGTARGEAVLLDFWSPQCGPCLQMMPVVDSLKAAGYRIEKINVVENQALAQQYGVTQIPCFVMLVDGREADRVVGATSGQRLQQMFPPEGRNRYESPNPQGTTGQDPWGPVGAGAPAQIGNGAAPAHADTSPQDVQLIASSVRLKVDDAKGHSYGTGTIIDTRSGEALIITCGHLFRDSQGQGPVTVELFEATPQGVRVVDTVPGHIVSYNVDREIGLVSIRPNIPVQAAPIASTQTVMSRGDRVTSVGCNNGHDPTALSSRVTATNRYQGPPNIEAQGAPVEGRSGGGLFNSAGELVGVCFAADYEGNEGLYTALESIHDELDRLNLTDVYTKGGPVVETSSPQVATATPPVVRGQEPSPPVMPYANEPGVEPATLTMNATPQGPQAAPSGLNAVERAAWDEIMARRVDSEVVCIVRPKQAGGKSEVITLDSVSPEFVQALAQQAGVAPATTR